jgi:hypothetical protein
MDARLLWQEETSMQIKAFLYGAAVASLAWLAVPAAADLFGFDRSESADQVAHWQPASAPGQTAPDAHAELMRRWAAMTPEERAAHDRMTQCPYAGQAHGRAGQGSGMQGLRPAREPHQI